jgi:hypothetical protein
MALALTAVATAVEALPIGAVVVATNKAAAVILALRAVQIRLLPADCRRLAGSLVSTSSG